MDIRTERTKTSIINAFIALRTKYPIEKITVKDIAEHAGINKATFYRHYEDIYALSEQLENDLILNCIQMIPEDFDLLAPDGVARLLHAFLTQSELVNIIFTGTRRERGFQKLHQFIMERLLRAHPEFVNDAEKQIILSSAIYGYIFSYYKYKHTVDFDIYLRSTVKYQTALINALSDTQ